MTFNLGTLTAIFLLIAFIGYRLYGGWLARTLALRADHPTPAVLRNDGIEFVPTKLWLLFPQHFSAIAAAGPIAGPISACLLFGWAPSFLWIVLGVVVIGAVHDFTVLTASIRKNACSIAELTQEQLGPRAGTLMLIFIWIALAYVIAAFTDVTASSFVVGTEELANRTVTFHPGGAVAFAAIAYLAVAVVMGMTVRFLKPPGWVTAAVFIPLSLGAAWLGTKYSTLFLLSVESWIVLILVYCAVASVLPIWALLQPRGFLGGSILYITLALGAIGLFLGPQEIQQPAFAEAPSGLPLFPFLFVTIACGACSGFHGLICSGTTSKQIAKETHAHPVGYGAMLAEAFVALVALGIVMGMSAAEVKGLKPGTIYGNGIGNYLTLLIGPEHYAFAVTLGAMAFSTFVFDTLDVGVRLGRYLLQELFRGTIWAHVAFCTILTVTVPALALLLGETGSWSRFWTLFGASNQLLAALSLMVIAVWLKSQGIRPWFVLFPMAFVFVITVTALGILTWDNLQRTEGFDSAAINGAISLALLALAAALLVISITRLLNSRAAPKK